MLVSARITFGGRGAPAGLLIAWFEGRFDLIASGALLGELEEVAGYLDLIRRAAVLEPEPPAPLEAFTPDPKDDYLIALARSSQANFLVSGDSHLTRLEDSRVLTPGAFLDLVS